MNDGYEVDVGLLERAGIVVIDDRGEVSIFAWYG